MQKSIAQGALSWPKVLISLFAAYNVLCFAVLGGATHLPKSVTRHFRDYGRTVGLGFGWYFFAPRVATPSHLQYRLYKKDSHVPMIVGSYPSDEMRVQLDGDRHRQLTMVQGFALDRNRLLTVFGNWLCRTYPEAAWGQISEVVQLPPDLGVAVKHMDITVSELTAIVEGLAFDYSCIPPSEGQDAKSDQ